jgi:hypothetical protein
MSAQEITAPALPPARTPRTRRRRRAVRAQSIRLIRSSGAHLLPILRAETAAILAEVGPFARPKTRGDCQGHEGPCPFVSCAHHLYLDVSPKTGAIKLNFPDLQPDELTQSCVLDVADLGGQALEEVGDIMNITRERVRQIEVPAKQRMAKRLAPILSDATDEPKVHLPMAVDDELAGLEELDVGFEAATDRAPGGGEF